MSSPRRLLVTAAAISLCASFASAQASGAGEVARDGVVIYVRVVQPNDRPVPEQVRVDLLNSTGSLVTAMFANSNGMVVFSNVPGGDYRLRATGATIQEVQSSAFYVDARTRNHSETLVVFPRVGSAPVETGPSVAVVDLSVPKPARKAVDKGVEAFNEGKFDKARQQFEKAIEQYPSYATAYNMLGLTFLRQQDSQRGQQAFEKAIELNDKFADAYNNLAQIFFRQQKYELCTPLLEKSIAAEPRNPEALTYLVQVELLRGNYEKAAAYARRVHELPHQQYAIVHFMAARALRSLNQRSDAVAQYKLFLQEASNNANSSLARKELAQLESEKP